jgi:hypothetical protein
MGRFRVYKRAWWKENPEWYNGLEPDGNARKYTLKFCDTEEEAREYAIRWNKTHDAGRLSVKAEYTQVETKKRK